MSKKVEKTVFNNAKIEFQRIFEVDEEAKPQVSAEDVELQKTLIANRLEEDNLNLITEIKNPQEIIEKIIENCNPKTKAKSVQAFKFKRRNVNNEIC